MLDYNVHCTYCELLCTQTMKNSNMHVMHGKKEIAGVPLS